MGVQRSGGLVMETKKCNQKDCPNPAAYRFTWPGRDEDVICETHVDKLKAVANALGFYLQVIELKND